TGHMWPEEESGKPLDARSNIFSFGVLLYEALSGNRPFGGSTDIEVLRSVIHWPLPPLNADIPAALRGIVEKALAKEVHERVQSMTGLTAELRRLGRGE